MDPSNQIGEIIAIKEAAELAPIDSPLKIISDSKYAIEGLTKYLQNWQDEGFHTVANGDVFALTVAKIRERRAPTELKWVKGHSGNTGNEAADVLAGEGSRKATHDEINTEALAPLVLSGAKLQAMTQSKAYKIIRKIEMEKPTTHALLKRPATKRNMKLAKEAATTTEGNPPARKIWRATRDKEISRSIRFFLWMLIHDGYKVGKFWSHIPGFRDGHGFFTGFLRVLCNHDHWGECPTCHNTWETMEHILTECAEPGQNEIWDLASDMWRLKTGKELRPSIGQIMAAGATKVGNVGEKRLYKILVTESAHLIWRIRNERRIQQTGAAALPMIKNRWLHAINNRLAVDCAMTNELKYGKKAVKVSLVKATWKKTLKGERTLAKDWPRTDGVLVGVG
ncbi:RnaseH-domain-containing protein [Mycena galopus ATCC 62051]|nr:RnaseH-domain-containing protein [Mycena galopus ATCC 62051]